MENMEEQIKNVIHKLRPYLQRDGGDIEYVDFKDGIVYVRMLGACAGCTMIDETLKDGVEQILMEEVGCFRSTKYFISIIVQISCIYREFVILCFSRWIHYKFLFTSHTYFR